MKDKKWIIIIIVLILAILAIVLAFTTRKMPEGSPSEGYTPNEEPVVEKSIYIMEEKKEEYSARTLESATKDYMTLFIETNIFEGEKTFRITYDRTKYTLETASPLLENVKIEKGENTNSFVLNLQPLENYSIILIKKDLNVVAEKEDVVIQIVNESASGEL